MKLQTNVTQIAAAQTRQNEQFTLAEGALAGERRVAVARIVMAAMLALLTDLPRLFGHDPETPLQTFVGGAYVVAALAVYVVLRGQRPDPHRGIWHARSSRGWPRDAADRVRDPDRVHRRAL